MKRLSWKYIAGLIDGEGCLDFQRIYHKNYPEKGYLTPRVRLTFSTPGLKVLETLQANHGGGLHHRVVDNPNWMDSSTWQIQGKKVRPFIQNIVNHLIIKKEQGRFLIWFIDNVMGKHQTTEIRECAKNELSAMKADPQRLSERAARKIQVLIKEKEESKSWAREYDACTECGTVKVPHATNGRCRNCDKRFKRKTRRADAIVHPA